MIWRRRGQNSEPGAESPSDDDGGEPRPAEARKRKREIVAVLTLCAIVLLSTWFVMRLLAISKQLPFVHSIFFFGLVNFNIILLLLLFFLIFRNVVKVFVERQGRVIGSSLKGKLIAAFVAFATVPTSLMFLVSVFYINSSFDKWFSLKMAGVLKNSLEVNREYIVAAKKRNYHFAGEVARSLRASKGRSPSPQALENLRERFSLDAVEYYGGLFGGRVLVVSKDEAIPQIPPVSLEFLRKGVTAREDSSAIHHFGEGNLVRVIIPVDRESPMGAIVVSSFIPMSLISSMDDISAAHEEFRNLDQLQYPLKSIYLIILVLMTLVILLCATWFGFYLARELAIPLQVLGRATRRVSEGDYRPVALVSGSAEINQLIENFNVMTQNLARSKTQVLEANRHLTETLERLDERSRYVQVVLSNVTTGVISVDSQGVVTTINRHASDLLGVDPEEWIGRPVKSLVSADWYEMFRGLLANMRERNATSLQQEMRIELAGQAIPLQMNLSVLQDEKGNDLGKVIVFDDLTPLLNAQRAAAWTEVARRIAHEIKNPLTPIKLSAQRLEKKFGAQIRDPAFSACVNMIIQQTDDLKRLVNEFSNFARLPQANPVEGSLHRTIADALELFSTAHRDVAFAFESDPSLPNFKFDPDQMKRVLINLLDNAVAAVLEGPASRGAARVAVRTQFDASLRLVRVTVADNGVGISEDDRAQVFEPYFSTKENGTGLGLSIVKRIVEDHNGFIRAFPNEPNGVKVIVELPVIEGTSVTPLPHVDTQTTTSADPSLAEAKRGGE